MIKLAGSVCILAGGALAWQRQRRERHRRRQMLGELLAALEDMGQEIRMARTPLPELLTGWRSAAGPRRGTFSGRRPGRPAGGRA